MIIIFLLFSFLYSSFVFADLPLTIENLLSEKDTLRSEISFTYANSEREGVEGLNPLSVQTSATEFINIPTVIGTNTTNTDILISTVGVRYGLTKKDEIYGRFSSFVIDNRSLSATGDRASELDINFSNAWIGINHNFIEDFDYIGLLGFAEIQLTELEYDNSYSFGKSYVIGGTMYKTYDPVVLSLTSSMQFNREIEVGKYDFQLGHSIAINPSIGFAVNDVITLTAGMHWRMQLASRHDNKKQGIRKTHTSLDFGLGYAIGSNEILNFSVRPQVSGGNNVQVSLNWIHNF